MFGSKLKLDATQDAWLGSNVTKQFIEAASDGKCNRKALKKGLSRLQKATKKDYNVKLSADLSDGDKLCLTLKSQRVGAIKQAVGDFFGDPIQVSYEFKNSSCYEESKKLGLGANRITEAFDGLVKTYKQTVSAKHLDGQSMSFAAKLLKKFR